MRKFLKEIFWFVVVILLLSFIFSTPRFAESAERKISTYGETGIVISVVDGDTFTAGSERIRISNIDTPELYSPHCPAEKRLARMAKARLKALLGDGSGLTIDREPKLDRYGRTLARVSVSGKDIGQALIDEGLAAEWTGRRFSWCCGAD